MTVLDRFLDFARALPEDRLQPVEEALAAIMASAKPETAFSEDEMGELDRRVAIAEPRYADPAEVSAALRRRGNA